jgi:CRISPR system Cascade subunit CasB
MPEIAPQKNALVAYLISLDARGDRAALAALRGALRPGRELDALRFVVPFLPAQGRDGASLGSLARRRGEDDAILLASLFALHPENGPRSLASVLNSVRIKTGSDSIEGRFRALLSAGRTDLAPHLRHAVSLVAGRKEAIDWGDLHRAIRNWDHQDDFVRREWARDFWAGAPEQGASAPAEGAAVPVQLPST